MNFLLRHQPVLTFDVDLWVRDTDENLIKTAEALRDISAQWGKDESSWGPVPSGFDWLKGQSVYCLTSPYGAVDIFREVRGLEDRWEVCRNRCFEATTAAGTLYASLSDRDMLACQMALPENERKLDRIRYLKQVLE